MKRKLFGVDLISKGSARGGETPYGTSGESSHSQLRSKLDGDGKKLYREVET